ncbi:MAG: LOG family protein [Melioribacteraceae bacterium]|nr:LOG family protein [Melioribacteraceae bacterium]WKZ68754.1 MAG: LOG family protein [Melioribacteraceae bacterium]
MVQKKNSVEKAYKNLEFLNSADARTVRILAEYYEPKSRLARNSIADTIVFFGSARIKSKKEAEKELRLIKKSASNKTSKVYERKLKAAERNLAMSHYYEDAVELSRRLTEWSLNLPTDEHRFIICSGGGPGIMEASNKGASLAGGPTIGLNISLPFEQFINKYVEPELAFEFHYFFMRKFWLIYLAKALIIFPGGFGTLDELMETITLIQTEKLQKKLEVVVYDEIFWKKIINFEALVEMGTISEGDLELFSFCNTVDEAFERITTHLTKNYLNNSH